MKMGLIYERKWSKNWAKMIPFHPMGVTYVKIVHVFTPMNYSLSIKISLNIILPAYSAPFPFKKSCKVVPMIEKIIINAERVQGIQENLETKENNKD